MAGFVWWLLLAWGLARCTARVGVAGCGDVAFPPSFSCLGALWFSPLLVRVRPRRSFLPASCGVLAWISGDPRLALSFVICLLFWRFRINMVFQTATRMSQFLRCFRFSGDLMFFDLVFCRRIWLRNFVTRPWNFVSHPDLTKVSDNFDASPKIRG